MEHLSIERGWVDLDAPLRHADGVIDLSAPHDARWTGIVEIAPRHVWPLGTGQRHDLYLLAGDAGLDGEPLATGDFAIRFAPAVVRAGERGARLLVYREPTDAGDAADHASPRHDMPPTQRAASRVWRPGRHPLLRVATLAGGGHHVSLVAWQPGARTLDHAHAAGEELLVLSGELRDGDARHRAGSWLRLHPGARHAPFAGAPAVILLRHGHLRATAGPRINPRATADSGPPIAEHRACMAGIDTRRSPSCHARAAGGTTLNSSAIRVSDSPIGVLSPEHAAPTARRRPLHAKSRPKGRHRHRQR
ncbi:cupin domain-containing protein [Burkholderia perseverans]|uniref:cupin domain-containing protein n=1 Tax=Burkholderia perseverans TaxID=2615214 RepID=UPI001FF0009C|nr:cupin domain-containing protein [Burkholderia perseverans]